MIFNPATAANSGTLVLQELHELPLFVEYLNSSVIVPVPPLPGVKTAVRVVPTHTVAASGDFERAGATGCAAT